MKFFAVAAALIAAVAAGGYGEDVCTVVTVTETVTAPYHVPSAPASGYSSIPPYPTTAAPYPSAPAPTGTGAPVPPVYPTGTAAPSGTGSYTPPPEFTGAASHAKVGGFVAGVGAIAALFL